MSRARKSRRLHVVVTAGPTREHVDPVRYLSNESSGRMGFAIAKAAAKAGHRVTLVAGPVALETPAGVDRVDVVSARDMLAAVRTAFAAGDALYMAAAVADWRPARKLAGKWRLKDTGAEAASLRLVRNPDVLATVARRKGQRLVVGFALETGAGLRRAKIKLKKKNADFVVLNSSSALNATRTTVTIISTDGKSRTMRNQTKDAVARALVGLLAEISRQPA
ncbi:MAG: phosphopantothenoylcysteine decarboxylase/phosphopantothenate--cysteine ligase [Chlamydiales bacterium]|jgi:phosphopantothenoylcysteine decarboxylase/phosphopantothenate--cysteine ligase